MKKRLKDRLNTFLTILWKSAKIMFVITFIIFVLYILMGFVVWSYLDYLYLLEEKDPYALSIEKFLNENVNWTFYIYYLDLLEQKDPYALSIEKFLNANVNWVIIESARIFAYYVDYIENPIDDMYTILLPYFYQYVNAPISDLVSALYETTVGRELLEHRDYYFITVSIYYLSIRYVHYIVSEITEYFAEVWVWLSIQKVKIKDKLTYANIKKCLINTSDWFIDGYYQQRDMLIELTLKIIKKKMQDLKVKLTDLKRKLKDFREKVKDFNEKVKVFNEKVKVFNEKVKVFIERVKVFIEKMKVLIEKIKIKMKVLIEKIKIKMKALIEKVKVFNEKVKVFIERVKVFIEKMKVLIDKVKNFLKEKFKIKEVEEIKKYYKEIRKELRELDEQLTEKDIKITFLLQQSYTSFIALLLWILNHRYFRLIMVFYITLVMLLIIFIN